MPLDLTSTTEEKFPVYLNPKTTSGKPTKIDGDPAVTPISGTGTYTPATEQEKTDSIAAGFPGLIGFTVSEDTAGATVYEVKADVDLGAGVKEIVDTINYSYNDPQASNLGLTGGTAVPKV